jgi:hypothetical protein
MRKIVRLILVFILGLAFITPCFATNPQITIDKLLTEMVDLKRLCEFPAPAYTEAEASSYDRSSTSPSDQTGWFANGDNSNYYGMEGPEGSKECVLLDVKGPGAIVRYWTANADQNEGRILRIYIDGNKTPALEVDNYSWVTGKINGFPPPLAMGLASGYNVYFPIPYQKSCKMTVSCLPGKAFYYQVNYRTYTTPGTTVEPFTMAAVLAAKRKIARVARQMSTATNPDLSNASTMTINANLQPGQTYSTVITGPAAIRQMVFSLNSPNSSEVARQCVLRIRFDNEISPCVEAPLGDFFGTAPGFNFYSSMPMSVIKAYFSATSNLLVSRWVMPFQQKAQLELVNYASVPVIVAGNVRSIPYEWNARSLYFHAGWRIEENIPTMDPRDWNILTVNGKGRYIGNMLLINNHSTVWWGEGDEKIYVNSETFPSSFGTGTEDYYGYAYGSSEIFSHAYHDQTLHDTPDCFGRDALNRWHILDDIPFKTDFRFDLEVWHWDRKATIDYATTAYWYAAPGATSNFKPLTKQTVPITTKPNVMRVPGAIEAEEMQYSTTGNGTPPNARRSDAGMDFSNQQLVYSDMQAGDTITFMIPAVTAGHYKLIGVFDENPGLGKNSYKSATGQYDVTVNGIAGPMGLNLSPCGQANQPLVLELGSYDLKVGDNPLVFKRKSAGGGRFVLDYVMLKE